jgi:hypothetical protein
MKYAAERRQVENQCTLSLVCLLEYSPDFLIYFVNHFYYVHKTRIKNSNSLEIFPHYAIPVKNRKPLHPDLFIKYMGKALIVFEMKIDSRVEEHQYLYGKQLHCPMVLLTKHIEPSIPLEIQNYTWGNIGQIIDGFLSENGKLRESSFIREFVNFLKEKKMYLPNSIVTRENFEYLSRMLCSTTKEKKISRGLSNAIDLLHWTYTFLETQSETLYSTHPQLKYFKSKVLLRELSDENESSNSNKKIDTQELKKMTIGNRKIYINCCIFRNNKQVAAGVSFGWYYNTDNEDWSFYTNYFYSDTSEAIAKKYVPRAESEYKMWNRFYREVYPYERFFSQTKKQLSELVKEWEDEVKKLGIWLSRSAIGNKAKKLGNSK